MEDLENLEIEMKMETAIEQIGPFGRGAPEDTEIKEEVIESLGSLKNFEGKNGN